MDGHCLQVNSMHRFRIDPNLITDARAPLSNEEAQHAFKVLRLRSGDQVQATDGCGRAWQGELCQDGEGAYITLLSLMPDTESPLALTLYMGLPKGEKLELIAQKACEIGCCKLVPVRMGRSVVRIQPQEAEKKLLRVRRIAAEAIKQCGRQVEMEITDPVDMNALGQLLPAHERAFFMWEKAKDERLADIRKKQPALRDIACVIGPEGGISEAEAGALCGWGALPVTMGPRILRAETAAIAACAQIMALWGDM